MGNGRVAASVDGGVTITSRYALPAPLGRRSIGPPAVNPGGTTLGVADCGAGECRRLATRRRHRDASNCYFHRTRRKHLVTSATQATVYEPVPGWPAIPHPMSFGEATSVAVDRQDRVYVFNRGHNPMMIFDRDGKFVDTWGAGQYQRAHGVYVAPDGNLSWWTISDHVVKKTTTSGRGADDPGHPGQSAAWQQGGTFKPSDRCLGFSGERGPVRERRVRKLAGASLRADGGHVLSWASPGSDPGQFSLPHHLTVLRDGRVVVCDRENFRLQVFDEEEHSSSRSICTDRCRSQRHGGADENNICR